MDHLADLSTTAIELMPICEAAPDDYQCGTDIIISETTCKRARETFSFRPLPHPRIKGRRQPIGIYSLPRE